MSFQEYSESLTSRLRIGKLNSVLVIGIFVIVLVAIASCLYFTFCSQPAYSEDSNEIELIETEQQDAVDGFEEKSSTSIYVHVAGCVKASGVYELPANSRANEAIEAAGGFSKSADKEAINLAEPITDGQQIIVPRKRSGDASGSSSSDLSNELSTNQSKLSQSAGSSNPNGKVNINTASSSELQTLSGIGEAKANKIISYREQNGSFKTVEDLTNVSGIGDKTLESLRPYICV